MFFLIILSCFLTVPFHICSLVSYTIDLSNLPCCHNTVTQQQLEASSDPFQQWPPHHFICAHSCNFLWVPENVFEITTMSNTHLGNIELFCNRITLKLLCLKGQETSYHAHRHFQMNRFFTRFITASIWTLN